MEGIPRLTTAVYFCGAALCAAIFMIKPVLLDNPARTPIQAQSEDSQKNPVISVVAFRMT